MVEKLGPLFKSTFRQAESNDTRQNIPHDERDKGRRKREEEAAKEEKGDLWEDNASVSVVALRVFLIDFLKTMPGGEDIAEDIEKNMTSLEGPDPSKAIKKRPHERQRPTNTHNAKAVRAYQTMAEHATPEPTNKSEASIKDDKTNKTAQKIQSQEIRDIYGLIQNLEILEKRNVQTLTIQKADSFVISLKNAVEKQISKI